MSQQQPLHFYKNLPAWGASPAADAAALPDHTRLEPSTCVEAEPFALQVLDESMQPEFKKGCIIVIDPTGRATHGSYVLARLSTQHPENDQAALAIDETLDGVAFRQLIQEADGAWCLNALNTELQLEAEPCQLADIIGVIVQRAGVRRRYHKRYDTG